MITAPGIYDLPRKVYHADPCPLPSLSSGLATTLITKSPRHAWVDHPRLNPAYEQKTATQFDIGTAAHALLLEGKSTAVIIDAPDYKKKAPKEKRDEAYAAGKTPLLIGQAAAVVDMVSNAYQQLAEHVEARDIFTPEGKAEQSLIWKDGDYWMRALPDWLPPEGEIIWDYKTTGGSAHPDSWQRTNLFPRGVIQASFYKRGAKAVLGWKKPRFRFVVQETTPPYALSVIEMTPQALDLADRIVDKAIQLWKRCTDKHRWPGYPARVAYIDAPGYVDWAWGERENREAADKANGEDAFALSMAWQAPLDHREVTKR